MNIYVGNLSYGTSESDLQAAFEQYGSVSSARIITDKYTGKSKGFGFVEMANSAEARQAIERLNGTEIGGRSVSVNEARPKEERSDRGGDRGGYGGGDRRGGGGGGGGRSRW
jgi:RNA recognition motif-containing protein